MWTADLSPRRPAPFDDVVTRWAAGPLDRIRLGDRIMFAGGQLALGHAIDEPRHPWRARGRLRGAGRLARGTRVELAVTPFADRAEVSLRPVRGLLTWTPSRERRYFDLAHDAATEVATALSRRPAA